MKRWDYLTKVGVCSLALSLSLCATGCKQQQPKEKEDNSYIGDANRDANDKSSAEENETADLSSDEEEVKAAQCTLSPTKNFKARGTVSFTLVDNGVKVVADIDGLTPGKHGFHVHEKGDCGNNGMAAGDHFNPTNSKHGGPDSKERHVGDLGNIVANSSGHAHYERIDKMIALSGPNAIIGRALVIHEKEDDYKTQPSGNSGEPIACGIIKAADSEENE